MTEQDWLISNDPAPMVEELRGSLTDRKAVLATAAAFRQRAIWVQICQGSANESDLRDLPKVVEMAERLADGVVGYDEARAQNREMWCCAEDFGFVPRDRFGSTFHPGWVTNLAGYCASDWLRISANAAWRATHNAAWGYWHDAVKDHPLLNDEGKVRARMVEVTARNHHVDFGGGPSDPWEYARLGPVRLSDVREASDLLRADETRTAAWDTIWDTIWWPTWQSAWDEVSCMAWEIVWASLPGCEAFDEKDWRDLLDEARDEAWERGPWRNGGAAMLEEFDIGGLRHWHEIERTICEAVRSGEPARQAAILRDIFGNPFHAVLIDSRWLSRNGGAAAKLARAAYDNRRLPEGTLEANRLAVLAATLEEAGCADGEILCHLRSAGPHFRGCWVVDALLGKR